MMKHMCQMTHWVVWVNSTVRFLSLSLSLGPLVTYLAR